MTRGSNKPSADTDLATQFEELLSDETEPRGRRLTAAASEGARRQPPEASATLVLPAEIHGIIARSSAPTCSIGWSLPSSLEALEVRPPGLALGDPLVGELAGLDLVEDPAHLGLASRR